MSGGARGLLHSTHPLTLSLGDPILEPPSIAGFHYIATPVNLLEVHPSLVDVCDMVTLPNGGQAMHVVNKMAGVRLKGSSEDVEFEAGRRIVSHTKGGVESVMRWGTSSRMVGSTRLTLQADYKVPIPVLGKLAEAVIVRLNEHEGEVCEPISKRGWKGSGPTDCEVLSRQPRQCSLTHSAQHGRLPKLPETVHV